LQARLEAALNRISVACESLSNRAASAGAPPKDSAAEEEVAGLQQEVARLSAALAETDAQRSRDLAELDTLIGQLKPLVEEV
ncbi:MAG: hypothetical protein AAFY59_17045, partial [Pseudomonadota bacterium]